MRRPALAIAFALYAVGFAVVTAFCYYDTFFRYAHRGIQLWTMDLAVEGAQPGRFNIVPLPRLALSIALIGGLVWCAHAFHRGDARARLVGFWLCFGWIAPQARFLALYLGFRHLAPWEAWAVAAAMVFVPAALLSTPGVVRAFAPHERELPWARLAWGRRRLVALGVLLAWMFYLAEIYLAAWPWFGPWLRSDVLGLGSGIATAVLAVASFFGLLRLRTWSVIGALTCGATTACAALLARQGALDAGYVGGNTDYAWIGSPAAVAVAFVPLALVTALLWPILVLIARRARGA